MKNITRTMLILPIRMVNIIMRLMDMGTRAKRIEWNQLGTPAMYEQIRRKIMNDEDYEPKGSSVVTLAAATERFLYKHPS